MLKKLIAILLISGISANASDVVFVEQGKPAPFTGYLFTPEMEKQTRYQLIESDFNVKRITLLNGLVTDYESQIGVYQKRLELYKNTSEDLAKQMVANRDVSFWEKSFYFILGATLTGVVSYGVVHTLR